MRRNLAIVPAFNEVKAIAADRRVRSTSKRQTSTCWSSTTARPTPRRSALRRAGAAVLRMPFNLGIGGAMQGGYIYALENGYEVAVQVDGDGQHDTTPHP